MRAQTPTDGRPARWAVAAALCAAVAGVVVAAGPAAKADPIGDARARAAALAHSIDALQTKAEVATERWDKADAELRQANYEQAQADDALNAIQAKATAARQEVADRTRALYESGGDPAVLASMLGGENPLDALDRYTMANAVISYEVRSANAAARMVASAEVLDAHDATITAQVTRLQIQANKTQAKIATLIAEQQSELANANGTIRRLLNVTEAAQLAQGAKDFASAVTAAGGTVGSGEGQAPNETVAKAIAWAKQQLGKPYQWGGTGPNSYDCSGLTQQAYLHAGVVLPRVAADQYNAGPHPSLANLLPGDLLFWATDVSNPVTIHHVTMYLGGGLMIAAPHTGTVIQIQSVYMPGFIGATRPWDR
jgi:cell wall-associated NlpC family hydrolase